MLILLYQVNGDAWDACLPLICNARCSLLDSGMSPFLLSVVVLIHPSNYSSYIIPLAIFNGRFIFHDPFLQKGSFSTPFSTNSNRCSIPHELSPTPPRHRITGPTPPTHRRHQPITDAASFLRTKTTILEFHSHRRWPLSTPAPSGVPPVPMTLKMAPPRHPRHHEVLAQHRHPLELLVVIFLSTLCEPPLPRTSHR
jgi:hypothetical protein